MVKSASLVVAVGGLLVCGVVAWSAEPPESFTVGERTFSQSNDGVPRMTVWMPLAIIVVPPFEKVIPKARMRDEDLVPLAILPETIYASFSQSTGQSGSTTTGMYARLSAAFGAKGGVPGIAEASFKAGIEAAMEASCGTSWEVSLSSTGTLGGVNWLVNEDAMVFAIRSQYTAYQYSAEGVRGKAEIYMPSDETHGVRLFDIKGWNAYAQEKNDAGQYMRDLPTFHCERPLSGNVDQYPTGNRHGYPVSAGDRFRSRPIFRMVGNDSYIDHHGGGLAGGMTVSAAQMAGVGGSVGVTMQFEAEGQGVTASVEGAVGATYTHEFSTSRSVNVEFCAGSIHEKLDGSTVPGIDYHYVARPRLYALSVTHAPDADFSRMLARRLSFKLQGAAVKGVTRAVHVAGSETNLVRADSKGQLVFAPTGQALAVVLAANGIQAVWDSEVPVFDFVVPEKGVSYSKHGVPIMPLAQLFIANGVLVPTPAEPAHGLWADLGRLKLDIPDLSQMVYVGPGSKARLVSLHRQLASINHLVYCGPKPGDVRKLPSTRLQTRDFTPQAGDYVAIQRPEGHLVMVNPALLNPEKPTARPRPGPWLSLPLMPAQLTRGRRALR